MKLRLILYGFGLLVVWAAIEWTTYILRKDIFAGGGMASVTVSVEKGPDEY